MEAAQAGTTRSWSGFLPKVNLSETWSRSDNPLMVFGTKLNQEIVSPADFHPAAINSPEPLSNYNTRLAFALSLVALLRSRHAHAHVHEASEHVHSHSHDDGHHVHAHPGLPPSARHTHLHRHESLEHAHPHWPDVHHRHGHARADAP